MKEKLIVALLVSLNIISLAILYSVLYSHKQTPIIIQQGLQTFFFEQNESTITVE